MKQVFFFFYIIVFLAFVYSCTNKQSYNSLNDVRLIAVNPNSRPIGQLRLSEIAESITYIPLETNDNCLIGSVTKCLLSENYILLYSSLGPGTGYCYLFSRTGHFVSQIGGIGHGPDEYVILTDLLQLDEQNNQIIIHSNTPEKIFYYDLTGRFIKSVSFENDRYLMSYHNGFYLLKRNNNGHTPFSYTIWDDDFNEVAQKITPIPFTMNPPNTIVGGTELFSLYTYDNHVHIRENWLNDTLYRINDDFSFTPKYIVNVGKYEMTVEIRSNLEIFRREAQNCLTIYYMYEIKDHLLMEYRFSNERVKCYYNKKEDKLLYFSSTSGIPNDYDGGLDYWPRFQNNNQLISVYSAAQIKDRKKGSKIMATHGHSEAIARFEQMSQKIDIEDNPVLVIVTLK